MEETREENAAGEEAYLIEVLEAASLLGVSRTRLSQLTSKGVFSFQRKKIGTRNRLFYRRSELLHHLNAQVTGRQAEPSRILNPYAGRNPYERDGVLEDRSGPEVSRGAPAPPHDARGFAAQQTQSRFPSPQRPTAAPLPSALSLRTGAEDRSRWSAVEQALSALLEKFASQDRRMDELVERFRAQSLGSFQLAGALRRLLAAQERSVRREASSNDAAGNGAQEGGEHGNDAVRKSPRGRNRAGRAPRCAPRVRVFK